MKVPVFSIQNMKNIKQQALLFWLLLDFLKKENNFLGNEISQTLTSSLIQPLST